MGDEAYEIDPYEEGLHEEIAGLREALNDAVGDIAKCRDMLAACAAGLWVSVEDDLPGNADEEYLVIWRSGRWARAWWCASIRKFECDHSLITHWAEVRLPDG